MLIGLYLYLPILSAWLQQASEKSLRLFLLLWGVTLLVPYLTQYATPNLWGTCAWNPYGMLYYFAGFNGYLVAGYYLRHYNRLSGRARAVYGLGHCYGRLPQGAATGPTDFRITAKAVSSPS